MSTSSVLPPSTLLPTAPSYIPSHTPPSSSTLVAPSTINGTSVIPSSLSILSEGMSSSSMYWDPNGFLLPSPSQSIIIPSAVPGPVQRPSPSFSPAPGTVNNTASRCIQRPSPEPRSCSTHSAPFPLYSPMNYAVGSSTSWNDTPVMNANDTHWNYTQEQQHQLGLSSSSTDFPLYDPFHSGAGISLTSTSENLLLTNGFSGRSLAKSYFHVFIFFL